MLTNEQSPSGGNLAINVFPDANRARVTGDVFVVAKEFRDVECIVSKYYECIQYYSIQYYPTCYF